MRFLFGEGGGSCGVTQEGRRGSINAPSCLLHCYFDFGCWLLCCRRCSSRQWDSGGEIRNLAVKKMVIFPINLLPLLCYAVGFQKNFSSILKFGVVSQKNMDNRVLSELTTFFSLLSEVLICLFPRLSAQPM